MAATRARFKIHGAVLDTGRPSSGTVTIDRAILVFAVRPARRRREYILPLATVAAMVVAKVIKAEVAEQRAARKAAGKRPRRRAR